MIEERTAPDAYGLIEVVCRMCGKANQVSLDFQERETVPVKCEDCGERRQLTAIVEDR